MEGAEPGSTGIHLVPNGQSIEVGLNFVVGAFIGSDTPMRNSGHLLFGSSHGFGGDGEG